MKCPRCSKPSNVTHTRPRPDGSIMRRHVCLSCGARFKTVELVENDLFQRQARLAKAARDAFKMAQALELQLRH